MELIFGAGEIDRRVADVESLLRDWRVKEMDFGQLYLEHQSATSPRSGELARGARSPRVSSVSIGSRVQLAELARASRMRSPARGERSPNRGWGPLFKPRFDV
jgi:hypothetical protein